MQIRERLKGYRTVIFHSLYGVPAAIMVGLDEFKNVDVRPLLEHVFKPEDVPFYLVMIALGGIGLRIITTTALGASATPEGPHATRAVGPSAVELGGDVT